MMSYVEPEPPYSLLLLVNMLVNTLVNMLVKFSTSTVPMQAETVLLFSRAIINSDLIY